MPSGNALDSGALPRELLKATPRQVRPSALGATMMFVASALVVAGIWSGIEFGRRADTSARHVGLFATERVLAAGDVIQLRKRGGDDGHRITAHYRYTARGRELMGATALRRDEQERYAVGSPVGVWYLPSEPEASWLDGYQPRRQPAWPATAAPFACGVAALALILAVRRQWNLLAYGRPAIAAVTNVQKKRSDKGTYWIVHYQWTTISGAKRAGKYRQGKRNVPTVGTDVPIVYDRDNTHRSSKYPMPFVSVR